MTAMTKLRQLLVCALLLVFTSGLAPAALFGGEKKLFESASESFRLGLWERAEKDFSEFLDKYSKSERVPEVLLLQAQSQFKQGRYAAAITLLSARQADAGQLSDQFVYWTGEAQFQSTNYPAAAATFARLARDFPNSSRRLEACVNEAVAWTKLDEWARAVELLQNPNGVFQQASRENPDSEFAARGQLLLAEAQVMQKDLPAAEAALKVIEGRQLKPELDWQRWYLAVRIQLGQGNLPAALQISSNLIEVAKATQRREFVAESVILRGGILEKLNRRDEAITVFQQNLSTNVPVASQRQALLKITDLLLAQNQSLAAGEMLKKFLNQFPKSPAADLALLTLGELYLKEGARQLRTNGVAKNGLGTTNLSEALGYFDRMSAAFSESAYVGRAQLGRGWCFWLDGKMPEATEAFRRASDRLPPSEDLAVARFKLGDALFAQTNYAGALENYRFVATALADVPGVGEQLGAPALYQMLRASLELKDSANANNAMERILQAQPTHPLAQSSVLLNAQGLVDMNHPDEARVEFEKFIALYPDSDRRPEVELALARTAEQKGDWLDAVGRYDDWLARYSTNQLAARAEFGRALANFRAGRETNAYQMFTNFVAQFATNELAPQAQWWVADYHYRQDDFADAEKGYKTLFQSWPTSDLAFQARMMAGRAALGRQGYSDAIGHFTKLTSDTNCPLDLRVQAAFAYGGAEMLLDSGETNRADNFKLAIQVFGTIPQLVPATDQAAQALGEIGKCYFQLGALDAGNYDKAADAFQELLGSTAASASTRSQARVGLALVAEAQARPRNDAEKTTLLKQARDYYLDVFLEKDLREGEKSDLFWLKKAGLEAARLTETLQEWPQAVSLYRRLQELLPPLKDSLEKKIERAQEHVTASNT